MWHGNPQDLVKHLFKKHEGELLEVEGWDVRGQGDTPPILLRAQFALTEQDFQIAKGMELKGKPAIGGKGQAWSNRAIKVAENGTWVYRRAKVLSLPGLFLQLGVRFSAARLYRYWNAGRLLLVKRMHAWGRPELDAAAKLRFREFGHYGHRD